MPRLSIVALATVLATAAGMAPASAGPEKVKFPADYRNTFVVYNEIERPDRKPAQIRFMYVNRAAADAARANAPTPHGAILIMEDRLAQLDAASNPVRGPDGRMIATAQATNVFVMEKQPGWGAEYATSKRNGEWEYSSFPPDGTPRAGLNTDGCFACHQARAGRDYTFTFIKWVNDGKPGR